MTTGLRRDEGFDPAGHGPRVRKSAVRCCESVDRVQRTALTAGPASRWHHDQEHLVLAVMPVEHQRSCAISGVGRRIQHMAGADGFDQERCAVGCWVQAPPLLFVAMWYPYQRVPASVGFSPRIEGKAVCDGDYEVLATVRGLAEVPELPWASVENDRCSLNLQVPGPVVIDSATYQTPRSPTSRCRPADNADIRLYEFRSV